MVVSQDDFWETDRKVLGEGGKGGGLGWSEQWGAGSSGFTVLVRGEGGVGRLIVSYATMISKLSDCFQANEVYENAQNAYVQPTFPVTVVSRLRLF